jgi:hypothetical protein
LIDSTCRRLTKVGKSYCKGTNSGERFIVRAITPLFLPLLDGVVTRRGICGVERAGPLTITHRLAQPIASHPGALETDISNMIDGSVCLNHNEVHDAGKSRRDENDDVNIP